MRSLFAGLVLSFGLISVANAQETPFSFAGESYHFSTLSNTCTLTSSGERFARGTGYIKTVNGSDYYLSAYCSDGLIGPHYPHDMSVFMWVYNTTATGFIAKAFNVDCTAKTFQQLYTSSGVTAEEINTAKISSVGVVTPFNTMPIASKAREICSGLTAYGSTDN